MHRLTLLLLAGFVPIALAADARAASFSFQGLGFLPGGGTSSFAHDISADGLVVDGAGHTASTSFEAFRWTSGGGMVGLGILPGGGVFSEAVGVSADGSVIVGESNSTPTSVNEVFRWTSGGGMVGLGFPLAGHSHGRGVSADGSVVVGHDYGGPGSPHEAFRWTSGDGRALLGFLPGGVGSEVNDVSADGAVIVGEGSSDLGEEEAFRWTSGGGMVGLGFLPGEGTYSRANAVSADGSVVVGMGSSASGDEAFHWTSGSMAALGFLPGEGFYSQANAVSADGAVIVGQGSSGSGDEALIEAFCWTSGGGMVSLRDLLVNHGVYNLTGWTLISATGVSADGNTIVGFGTNPDGDSEGWIATVPEPSTWALALCGALGLLIVSRHRRSGPVCPPGSTSKETTPGRSHETPHSHHRRPIFDVRLRRQGERRAIPPHRPGNLGRDPKPSQGHQ